MSMPKKEVWYCWREFTVVDGEDTPRLVVPWSDPYEYEHPADGIFETQEDAEKWKEEDAPDEEWVLCRMTLEPFLGYKQCPDCNQVKKYDADVWRNYSNQPGSGTRYVCGDCAPKENDDGRGEPQRTEAEAG